MIRNFIIFLVASLFLISIGVLVIQIPAFYKGFNLVGSQSLANAINGLTAPFIGLISAFLLYQALTEQVKATQQQAKAIDLQVKAIKQQDEQSQINIAHNLLLQVEKNIEQFFWTPTTTTRTTTGESVTVSRETNHYSGWEALHKWCNHMKGVNIPERAIGVFFQIPLLILIIRSLSDLDSFVIQSSISSEVKAQFSNRVKLLTFALKDPLKELNKGLDNRRIGEDEFSSEIRDFMKR